MQLNNWVNIQSWRSLNCDAKTWDFRSYPGKTYSSLECLHFLQYWILFHFQLKMEVTIGICTQEIKAQDTFPCFSCHHKKAFSFLGKFAWFPYIFISCWTSSFMRKKHPLDFDVCFYFLNLFSLSLTSLWLTIHPCIYQNPSSLNLRPPHLLLPLPHFCPHHLFRVLKLHNIHMHYINSLHLFFSNIS